MSELAEFGYGDRVLLLDGLWAKVVGFTGRGGKAATVKVEGTDGIRVVRMRDVRILKKAER